MILQGDTSPITAPGQFVNLQLDGLYLRRPISVCDVEGDRLTLIYKVVGRGTEQLSRMVPGEKLDALEPFYPDRMASRILGMGDVLSLIEKAQSVYDAEEAKKIEKKIRKNDFTLDDFLDQLQQIRKMGSFGDILGMLPGMGNVKKQLEGVDVDLNGKEIKHVEAIIRSMTPAERADITIVNGSRRKRIAQGSGTRIQDVNKVLKQFAEMRKMMKKMKKLQGKGLSRFRLPFLP